MIIPFALYKNGEAELRIRPSDIASYEEYHQRYRNHLFCCEEGCPAQIEWAHRMGRQYFRTWRHSKHAPDCFFAFENDPSRAVTRATDTIQTRISDEHKKASLRSASRMQKADDGLIPRKTRTSVTPNPNRPGTRVGGNRRVASLDPEAEPVETGGKEPRIYNRKCEDVTPKDHGKVLNVRGRIARAVIKEQSVRFVFDTNDEDVSILFYNSFRDVSPQSYRWVEEIAKRINWGTFADLQVCCVCSCEWKDSVCTLQVYDPESIYIRDMPLVSFVQRTMAEDS